MDIILYRSDYRLTYATRSDDSQTYINRINIL